MSININFFAIIIIIVLLFAAEIIYFRIAKRYNIIDQPNHRSSHSTVTIRGGGVIFSVAILIASFYFKFSYWYFVFGLVLISGVSFIDDIKTIGSGIRICFHIIAAMFMFYQLGLLSLPLYLILISLIFAISTINAMNFMDGINGITGAYGIVFLLTLFCINSWIIEFTSSALLLVSILAVLVFIFFNFRTKAICFAGDVGSVSLAFIIVFLLLQLIIKTENLNYIFLMLVYGLDTSTTIVFRLIRKEKISEAHRSHFYQHIANIKKVPQLIIAAGYAITQLLINLFILNYCLFPFTKMLLCVLAFSVLFIMMRFMVEGPIRLLNKKSG